MTVRPFNARSLTLSVLLGLPDPRLDTASLLRLADLFGIAPGTERTAISRMVAAGELVTTDGGYALSGRLLERKAAQDVGREPPPTGWDGTWWLTTAVAPVRSLAARREFRTAMINGRLAELRPDTWLRPANTPRPTAPADAIVIGGHIHGADPEDLIPRLWDLEAVAARAVAVAELLDKARSALDDSAAAIPDATLVAADVVRFLREEPYLPPSITPPDWPVDRLRRVYRDLDRELGRRLRRAIGA